MSTIARDVCLKASLTQLLNENSQLRIENSRLLDENSQLRVENSRLQQAKKKLTEHMNGYAEIFQRQLKNSVNQKDESITLIETTCAETQKLREEIISLLGKLGEKEAVIAGIRKNGR